MSFLTGAILVVSGDGITLTNVTVVSETQITADVTVGFGATGGARLVLVELAGTGAGLFTGSIGLGFVTVT